MMTAITTTGGTISLGFQRDPDVTSREEWDRLGQLDAEHKQRQRAFARIDAANRRAREEAAFK